MTKSVQSIINAAYSSIGGDMNFVIVITDIVGKAHRFYFHEARVMDYQVSVWESPFHANPVELTITSRSGLKLRLIDTDRKGVYSAWVVNPHRMRRRGYHYGRTIAEPERCLSYREQIAFVRV